MSDFRYPYGLRIEGRTSMTYEGRRNAHGMAAILRRAHLDVQVMIRDSWTGPWRQDPDPNAEQQGADHG